MKKQRLELTWTGKDERLRLEPRILIEDFALSYHASTRMSDGDIFENMLIQGDNLLALKALETEFSSTIGCIYIDPPYNTGSAFHIMTIILNIHFGFRTSVKDLRCFGTF